MAVKVQIYLNRPQDAAAASAAGADFIGLCCDRRHLLPESLDYAAARAVFAACGPGQTRVALTVADELVEILEMIDLVEPHVVHLSGRPLPVGDLEALRSRRPRVKVMQAVAMNDPSAVDRALAYQAVADFLLLDTNEANDTNGQGTAIGATGRTHDWSLSAEVRRRSRIPVFLAGGLSAENVAEAVAAVEPWGVDSYSLTNLPGFPGVKDPARMAAFVAAARAAASAR